MTLNDLFIEIRLAYFPKWDQAHDWKIEFGTAIQTRNNTGYCDSIAQTIYLDFPTFLQMSAAGQCAFIIHEICHEVGAANHNRRWAKRMEKAAHRAAFLDQDGVARVLRSEIYSYFGNGLVLEYNRAGIYDYAQEVVNRKHDVTFEELLRKTAKFFGFRVSKVERDFGNEIHALVD